MLRHLDGWSINLSEPYAEHRNGSRVLVAGFDDQDRVEKILGTEFATVYLNEVSQISYDTALMARTRLAQVVPGCKQLAIYDCNPPSPTHWSFDQFMRHVDPRDKHALDPEQWRTILMNPADNAANLSREFLEELDHLPERMRRRMRDGEYVKPEGACLYAFDFGRDVVDDDAVPQVEEWVVGVDFGINSAAVLVGFVGDTAYVVKDHGALNTPARRFNEELRREFACEWSAFGDPAGGERLSEIDNCTEADNAVEPGLDLLNTMFEHGHLKVCRGATNVLGEIGDYHRDEHGRIVKEGDHFMDALRYAIFSRLGARVTAGWA